MPKENSTEIIFVVDRSGSMQTIATDMCGGFDNFIAEQQKVPGECRVTLVQFDTAVFTEYSGRSIERVPPLLLVPQGYTALLDAVGKTIDETGVRFAALPEEERPAKVLFVVVTDGHENSSNFYTRTKVFEMIKHQREAYHWEFVFLGANQDAFATAQSLSIGTSVTYDATRAGAKALFGALSASSQTYRGGGELGDVQASYNAGVRGA